MAQTLEQEQLEAETNFAIASYVVAEMQKEPMDNGLDDLVESDQTEEKILRLNHINDALDRIMINVRIMKDNLQDKLKKMKTT